MDKNSNSSYGVVCSYNKGYRVTSCGKLISPTGKELSTCQNKNGYLRVNIRIDRGCGYTNLFVHQLQAYQKFGDKIFDLNCVRHLNGDKLNNSISNIHIGTDHDNQMDRCASDRLRHSLLASKQRIKYDKNKVRSFYSKCLSYKQTMDKFNISSKGTLHFILNSKTYDKLHH